MLILHVRVQLYIHIRNEKLLKNESSARIRQFKRKHGKMSVAINWEYVYAQVRSLITTHEYERNCDTHERSERIIIVILKEIRNEHEILLKEFAVVSLICE